MKLIFALLLAASVSHADYLGSGDMEQDAVDAYNKECGKALTKKDIVDSEQVDGEQSWAIYVITFNDGGSAQAGVSRGEEPDQFSIDISEIVCN